METFEAKQHILQRTMNRKVKFNYHHSMLAVLESAFARGGRELNQVLFNAYQNGCYFDSWPDYFNQSAWEKAFSDAGFDPHALAQRTYDYDDMLPWDFIDMGIDKEFFIEEAQKAKRVATTPNCYECCSNCGISKENGRCNFEI